MSRPRSQNAARQPERRARRRKANLTNPQRAAFFADCDVFVAVVAEKYFELCVSAIKAADPNHLVIGSPVWLSGRLRL